VTPGILRHKTRPQGSLKNGKNADKFIRVNVTAKQSIATLIIAVVLGTAVPVQLHSQDGIDASAEKPSWLIYEEGILSLEQGELGTALSLFRKALRLKSSFPEAEAGLGMVYEAEGEYILAEKQYLNALRSPRDFYIQEELYAVKYRLSEIYEFQKEYKKYLDTLAEIITDDPFKSNPLSEDLEDQYRRVLLEDGFNKLLILYRLDDNFARKAHTEYGILQIKMGRYDHALDHLILSALRVFTKIISELLARYPDYRFESIESLAAYVTDDEKLSHYAKKAELYRILYYLASASYSKNAGDTARSIWSFVSNYSSSEKYRRMASLQLRNPHKEPLLFDPRLE
jgi:tetratricopeptide (TPR) repeat protein